MTPLRLPDHPPVVAGVPMPSATQVAGYSALIAAFDLHVPAPDEMVAIGEKHTLRREGRWRVLTPRYRPPATVAGHVKFALKHEGVDLAVLSALFHTAPRQFIEHWVRSQPTGRHARRAWFLYEWLTDSRLALPEAPKAPYVGVLEDRRQFSVRGETVLEHYSRPRLALTRWRTTPSLNVHVVNETRDLFRFFDATQQTEFLADSVVETIRVTLPREMEYLRRYDQAKRRVEAFLALPDATFDLMMGFLRQNDGRFSGRARAREFARLSDQEAASVEAIYQDLLLDLDRPGGDVSGNAP